MGIDGQLMKGSVGLVLNRRGARDPPKSLDHSDPPPFLSLDPSLEKRDYDSDSLDPASVAKTQSRSSLF